MDLFRIEDRNIASVKAARVDKEKVLQELVEHNVKEALRVRFFATEYSTGEKHAGRIGEMRHEAK